ncbi:ZrgA family zinc uptake protein [Zooshikella sp. RANM57]|uniref:ZrgA family zinc uptake protein n=1 Tax=Zooshikella sp. RANM57 TaxID=3425863 RepID=UPI003D6FF61E
MQTSFKAITSASLLFILALPATAEVRQHGAHEHGSATLNIAYVDNTLEVELLSPAMNLVGFEHMPENDEQFKQLNSALSKLKQAHQLFGLPSTCKLKHINFEGELVESLAQSSKNDHHEHEDHHKSKDEHDHDEEEHHHSDIHAHYQFGPCKDISQLNISLIKQFPGLEHVTTQVITSRAQTQLQLNSQQQTVPLSQ